MHSDVFWEPACLQGTTPQPGEKSMTAMEITPARLVRRGDTASSLEGVTPTPVARVTWLL